MDVVAKQQKQNGDYKVQAQQLVLYGFFSLVCLYRMDIQMEVEHVGVAGQVNVLEEGLEPETHCCHDRGDDDDDVGDEDDDAWVLD
jgi:hypothetical protein